MKLATFPVHVSPRERKCTDSGSAYRAPPPTLSGQEVVESAALRDPDLRLADEPLLRVGIVDGPLEYIFGNVTGAVRLEDGGIVVADEQSGNIRGS